MQGLQASYSKFIYLRDNSSSLLNTGRENYQNQERKVNSMAIIKKDKNTNEAIYTYENLSTEEALSLFVHLSKLDGNQYRYELVSMA